MKVKYVFYRNDTFCDFLFPAHHATSEKGSTLKGKSFLTVGADCLLLEKTLFRRETKSVLTVLPPPIEIVYCSP